MNTIDSPRSRMRPLLILAALLLAGLATWIWLDRRPAAANAAPVSQTTGGPRIPVTTAPVQQRDVPIFRSGIGSVTPRQTVTVTARVDGQLDSIGFTEGQDVKAGQVLARLDPRALQAVQAQAQAQKARDTAQLGNARLDLARYTRLIAEEASTRQQVDTQKALVAQLEAAVRNDEATIQSAQVQLGYTTITAPISGRVGARLVDVGNIVRASSATPIVVINEIDPITVVFTLPEAAFQAVNAAINAQASQKLAVQARTSDDTQLLATGHLVLLDNQIDTTTGTIRLKAQFDNASHVLWPGQFVNARLLLGTREQALTVPTAAIQRGQSGTYVYAVGDDGRTVNLQPVTLTGMQEGEAVVAQGLAAGQRVVVDGQYKLKPGAAITESAPAQGTPKAAAAVPQEAAADARPPGAKTGNGQRP